MSKNKGYFSETVNSYQLGKITENQWAGTELLLSPDAPLPFSLISSTHVEALEISKKALFDKLLSVRGISY